MAFTETQNQLFELIKKEILAREKQPFHQEVTAAGYSLTIKTSQKNGKWEVTFITDNSDISFLSDLEKVANYIAYNTPGNKTVGQSLEEITITVSNIKFFEDLKKVFNSERKKEEEKEAEEEIEKASETIATVPGTFSENGDTYTLSIAEKNKIITKYAKIRIGKPKQIPFFLEKLKHNLTLSVIKNPSSPREKILLISADAIRAPQLQQKSVIGNMYINFWAPILRALADFLPNTFSAKDVEKLSRKIENRLITDSELVEGGDPKITFTTPLKKNGWLRLYEDLRCELEHAETGLPQKEKNESIEQNERIRQLQNEKNTHLQKIDELEGVKKDFNKRLEKQTEKTEEVQKQRNFLQEEKQNLYNIEKEIAAYLGISAEDSEGHRKKTIKLLADIKERIQQHSPLAETQGESSFDPDSLSQAQLSLSRLDREASTFKDDDSDRFTDISTTTGMAVADDETTPSDPNQLYQVNKIPYSVNVQTDDDKQVKVKVKLTKFDVDGNMQRIRETIPEAEYDHYQGMLNKAESQMIAFNEQTDKLYEKLRDELTIKKESAIASRTGMTARMGFDLDKRIQAVQNIAEAQRDMIRLIAEILSGEGEGVNATLKQRIEQAAETFKVAYNENFPQRKYHHVKSAGWSVGVGLAMAAVGVGAAFLAFFALPFIPGLELALFSTDFFITLGSVTSGLGLVGVTSGGAVAHQHYAHGDNVRGTASREKNVALDTGLILEKLDFAKIKEAVVKESVFKPVFDSLPWSNSSAYERVDETSENKLKEDAEPSVLQGFWQSADKKADEISKDFGKFRREVSESAQENWEGFKERADNGWKKFNEKVLGRPQVQMIT